MHVHNLAIVTWATSRLLTPFASLSCSSSLSLFLSLWFPIWVVTVLSVVCCTNDWCFLKCSSSGHHPNELTHPAENWSGHMPRQHVCFMFFFPLHCAPSERIVLTFAAPASFCASRCRALRHGPGLCEIARALDLSVDACASTVACVTVQCVPQMFPTLQYPNRSWTSTWETSCATTCNMLSCFFPSETCMLPTLLSILLFSLVALQTFQRRTRSFSHDPFGCECDGIPHVASALAQTCHATVIMMFNCAQNRLFISSGGCWYLYCWLYCWCVGAWCHHCLGLSRWPRNCPLKLFAWDCGHVFHNFSTIPLCLRTWQEIFLLKLQLGIFNSLIDPTTKTPSPCATSKNLGLGSCRYAVSTLIGPNSCLCLFCG